MNELMRQASRMQRKIDQAKADLKDQEVTGTAAGDRVSVVVTCEGKVRQIKVDPEFVKSEGLDLVLDSIVAATNAALDSADKLVDAEIDKVTGGVKIPGMK